MTETIETIVTVDDSALRASTDSAAVHAAKSAHTREVLITFLHADLNEMDALIAPDAYWWGVGIGDMDRSTFISSHAPTLALGPPLTKLRTLIGLATDGEWGSMEWTVDTVWPDRAYRQIYHHSFIVRDGLVQSMRMYMDQGRAKEFYPDLDVEA